MCSIFSTHPNIIPNINSYSYSYTIIPLHKPSSSLFFRLYPFNSIKLSILSIILTSTFTPPGSISSVVVSLFFINSNIYLQLSYILSHFIKAMIIISQKQISFFNSIILPQLFSKLSITWNSTFEISGSTSEVAVLLLVIILIFPFSLLISFVTASDLSIIFFHK